MKRIRSYKGYGIYSTSDRERRSYGITALYLLFTPQEEYPAIGYQEWEADSMTELMNFVDSI